MTLTLAPDTTAPDTTCDVCGAWPLNQCHSLDGHPLPVPHPERTETTPLYDALAAAHAGAPIPLSSRRRTDAGTSRTVSRQPGKAAASARSSSSTRLLLEAAGQGNTIQAGGRP